MENISGGRRKIVSLIANTSAGAAALSFARLYFVTAPSVAEAETLYLNVTYIPPGYALRGTWTDRNDGFMGGKDEVMQIYSSPRFHRGFVFPLTIVQAPAPKEPLFSTDEHPGERITLTMETGVKVDAEYWNGWWAMDPNGSRKYGTSRMRWATEDSHALVFKYGSQTIGIRGFRSAQVSYEELLKVAASLKR